MRFQNNNNFGGKSPGRPRLTDDQRRYRDATNEEIARAWGEHFMLPVAAINAVLKKPTTAYIDRLVLEVMLRALKKADWAIVEKIVERVAGRPFVMPDDQAAGELGSSVAEHIAALFAREMSERAGAPARTTRKKAVKKKAAGKKVPLVCATDRRAETR